MTHLLRLRAPLLTVKRVLRGEWLRLPSLAAHADRALRALTARNVAASAHASARTGLDAVLYRAGWSQRGEREFVHTFGTRQFTITIPPRFDAPQLAALITRAEISTLLGDCDWPLLTHLQALAASELQHLGKENVA